MTGGVQLLGDQSVLAVAPVAGASAQNLAPNVFYLAGRLVDKLWQGVHPLPFIEDGRTKAQHKAV